MWEVDNIGWKNSGIKCIRHRTVRSVVVVWMTISTTGSSGFNIGSSTTECPSLFLLANATVIHHGRSNFFCIIFHWSFIKNSRTRKYIWYANLYDFKTLYTTSLTALTITTTFLLTFWSSTSQKEKGTFVQKLYTDMKWALLKLKIPHNTISSEIDMHVKLYFRVKIHVEPQRISVFCSLLLYGPWKIIGLTRTNMVDAIIEFLMGFLQPVYYILLLYYVCIFRGKQWKIKKSKCIYHHHHYSDSPFCIIS